MLALNLWKQKRPEAALVHATRAAQDPWTSVHDRVHHLHCMILFQLGRYEEAVAAGQAAVWTQYPAPHYYFLGRVLARLGRTDEAIAVLHRAIAGDRHIAAWHRELGNQLERAGRFAEAATAFVDADRCDAKCCAAPTPAQKLRHDDSPPGALPAKLPVHLMSAARQSHRAAMP